MTPLPYQYPACPIGEDEPLIVVAPRCKGSLRRCGRCGKVPACPNGEHRTVRDPRTGELVTVIYYCSID